MLRTLLISILALLSLYGQETLSQPTSNFSFAFYHDLQPGENALFSPFSIYTCLAMPYLGAEGDTRAQFQSLLGLSSADITTSLRSYMEMVSSRPNNEKSYQLNIASGLWMANDISILGAYRKTIEQDFHAALQTVNFAEAEKATNQINGWISTQTQDKIPHLLAPSDVNNDTKLVLANAIYFKGAWLKPFDPIHTQMAPFWKDEESCLNTPMMEETAFFLYHETDTFQLLALPFIGRAEEEAEIAFVVLLPKQGEKFPKLSAPLFTDLLSNLSSLKVHVKLPKFTLDERLDLNKTLISMGLKNAFTSGVADFSGINGGHDLYFNKAIHQTFISVDEAGVTAAAATAIGMNTTSTRQPSPITEFTADHPFLFFIVDLNAKIPLFMGQLSLPP